MSRVVNVTGKNGVTLQTKDKIIDDDIAIQVDGAENITANNIKSGVTILGVSGNMATVVANPTLEGGESDLTSVEIEGTKYAIPSGTEVTANPTLDGNETALSGLEVDGTKYSVGGGGGSTLYTHLITLEVDSVFASFSIISKKNSAFTFSELQTFLETNLKALQGWQGSYPACNAGYNATKIVTAVIGYDGYIFAYYYDVSQSKLVRSTAIQSNTTIRDIYTEVV